MRLYDLLLESKGISIQELGELIETSKDPVYIVVAGSVGSGKSYIVNKHLPNVDTVDPDNFTMQLGDGVYDGKNVAKAMALVKKDIAEKLSSKTTFIQQGTSANLQATINKLEKMKKSGFTTALLFVDAPIEQAIKQIEQRVASGGHGETLDRKKVETTSNSAKLTFRALSGVDFDMATEEDVEKVNQVLEKIEKTLDNARKNLDYFVRIDNKY